MGIDIYAKWKGQTKDEEEAQYTGFSVVSGNVGYLREAYHGGPYVTHYLLDEAFKEGEAQIPAEVLKKRLPTTVLLSLFRNHKVYGDAADKTKIEIENLPSALKNIFSVEVKDESHKDISKMFDQPSLELASEMIKNKILPDYAQSFVDFVELCEKKENETGEPCTIIASY